MRQASFEVAKDSLRGAGGVPKDPVRTEGSAKHTSRLFKVSGKLPLARRLPFKRGFTNIFRTEYTPVNLGELASFESGSEVTPESLVAAGVIKNLKNPIKILAVGEIKNPLIVKAHKFSATAKSKIETAGGKAEEVEYAAKAE